MQSLLTGYTVFFIAACMLVRHAGQTQRDVALLLGLRSGSSVSCQLRRLAELAKDDRRVSELIARAERRLAGAHDEHIVSRYSKG